MSNEEFAAAIKAGNTDLYSDLWNQVQRFVIWKARQRYVLTNGVGSVEVEDLVQSGFLALVSAVHYFDPASGVSFLTVLGNCLKTAFSTAGGYRTTKRNPLDKCSSLNTPLNDEEDGDTLLDMIEEPRDYIEELEEKIWRDDLRAVLEKEVSALPLEQMETIYKRFARGQTFRNIGISAGVPPDTVRRWEYNGLSRLRTGRQRAELEQFLDECTDFYTRVGVSAFQRTGESAVEKLAIKRETIARHFE